ncbi:MAG: hypothetical protein ACJA0C_000632 [Candidatus Endobugula sp.]|jgi:hypothetical protein
MQINKPMALMLASFLLAPKGANRVSKKRSMSSYILRFLLLSIFVIFVLSACQSRDSAEYIFENYLYRLSNSLQVDRESLPTLNAINTSSLERLSSYPVRRELQNNIPSININLLEFLRLSECELQRHIGQRNGGLGRVMGSTQQLIYDAKFIALAEPCLSQLESTSALSKTLTLAYDHKIQYLSASIWNASFASKEFSYLFSLGTNPLSLTAAMEQPLQLSNALKIIAQRYERLMEGGFSAESLDDIETYYQVVESSKRIGELRLSLQATTRMLQQADNVLSVRINEKPLCRQQQSNAQFTIVNNVFYKYYIGQVQPYIAGLHQQGTEMFVIIDALVRLQVSTQGSNQAQTKQLNDFWGKVYRDDDSEWQLFNQQVKAHTLHWQALLKQCGKLPS